MSNSTNPGVSVRPSASRKLLASKAIAKNAAALPSGDALEESFPALATDAVAEEVPSLQAAQPPKSPRATPPSSPQQLAAAPAWSHSDEQLLQNLQAQRKAAGYQRRGRDHSAQVLRVGTVAAQPGTVVGTIVAIVAAHGEIKRGALLDAMSGAVFAHPKAKPQDRGWRSGWLSGALRGGFLAVADASISPEASR